MDEPEDTVAGNVTRLLASAERARAAGVACLVDGKWLTVHVNLTVLHQGMQDPSHLDLERDGICAFDVLLGRQELESLVAGLRQGGVRLPASCRGATVPEIVHPETARCHGWFLSRPYARRDWGIDWPCDEVVVQGGGFQCDALPSRLRAFIEALSAMDPPFEDVKALRRDLGIRGDLTVDRGGLLNIRRPLPLRLYKVAGAPTVNEIEISVEAYGSTAREFSVGVMPATDPRAARLIPAEEFAPVGGGVSLLKKRVRLSQPGPVKVSLVARERTPVDDMDAGTPWAPLLVHQHFDPECGLLLALLFGSNGDGQKQQREFESGVAWLLHLCGCAAMHLGRSKGSPDLQATPDIVARTPSGNLLIGECSLRIPEWKKVGKLLERARSVDDVLQRAGVPSKVRAVFFVGEECADSADGVEFVDRARLKEIVERLRGGRLDGLCC